MHYHASRTPGAPLRSILALSLLAVACSIDTTDEPAEPAEPDGLPGEAYEGEYTHAFADPMEYFSDGFTEADDKFVQACGRADGRLEYVDHRLRGKDGEPLRAVICRQGPEDAVDVLVTLSGTHGVEGFAGSAAQIGILVDPDVAPLPERWAAVHVHMINPYGASWVLKENEDNADVYKNYAALYDAGIDNPILVDFIDRLDMPSLGDLAAQQAATQVLPMLFEEHGQQAVLESLVLGQGERPFGIAYYGPDKSWSTEVLERVADTYLAEAERIVLIDFHTAVGEYGTWTALSVDETSQATLETWLAGTGTALFPSNVPTGPEPAFEWVREPSGAKMVRAIVEAGTYPADAYQTYFILNLYCRYFAGGWDSDLCAVTRTEIGEYFYPKGADWKESTWATFLPMWEGIMGGMEAGF